MTRSSPFGTPEHFPFGAVWVVPAHRPRSFLNDRCKNFFHSISVPNPDGSMKGKKIHPGLLGVRDLKKDQADFDLEHWYFPQQRIEIRTRDARDKCPNRCTCPRPSVLGSNGLRPN